MMTAAARALAAGDPLGAPKRVALRDDPPALALRGIAMAQLGDFVRAEALVEPAARAFGPREAVARSRCVVARAEMSGLESDGGDQLFCAGTSSGKPRTVRRPKRASATRRRSGVTPPGSRTGR